MTVRHLVSIDDLSLAEIRELFALADRFASDLRGHADLCRGMISASLFYEPSTRTRLSFESAMLRLGGGVLTAADMRSTSASKGESLADTVRVVSGGYSDVIVLRHPSEGAARLASMYSSVPVINAGDGSHEHPTQTLCDLYNLWVERGRIEGIEVVLAGDLRYSRTIHSFAYALARFGANVICVPTPGFELPDYVVQRLREEFGVEPQRADASRLGDIAARSDAVYLTPQKPHQLSLFTHARGLTVERVDAVYMTRPQTERHPDGGRNLGDYVRLGKHQLAAESLRDAVVMHPLPRRDEISAEIDDDPRSIYFKQASRGVPIRMALMAYLLGRIELRSTPRAERATTPGIDARSLLRCRNERCITNGEGVRYLERDFRVRQAVGEPPSLECAYCERELVVRYLGHAQERWCVPVTAEVLRGMDPDQRVWLESEEQARAAGFQIRGGTD